MAGTIERSLDELYADDPQRADAVAFGRRSLGPGTPPARSCLFSLNAARNALARGNAVEALREATRALAVYARGGLPANGKDILEQFWDQLLRATEQPLSA